MAAVIGAGTQSNYRLAQEREFYTYMPQEDLASPYAPFDEHSNKDFVPQPSSDPSLTAYAQLATFRLGTETALISLFSRTHQHILAEGTPSLGLTDGSTENDSDKLWLGCCVFPKERGFCRGVEASTQQKSSKDESNTHSTIFISLDATKDDRFRPSNCLKALSNVRFYAAAPLVTSKGYHIGALSVLDTKARSNEPDQHALGFLTDMATTVMKYLEMKHTTQKARRAERMILGLGSFVEGRTTLRGAWEEAKTQHQTSERSGETEEGQLNYDQQDLQQQDMEQLSKETGQKTLVIREPWGDSRRSSNSSSKAHKHARPEKDSSRCDKDQEGQSSRSVSSDSTQPVRSVLAGEGLEDKTLPSSIRNIFSRAANLLRESIGAEGVMFLDANSERYGNLVDQNRRRVSGFDTKGQSSGDESSPSRSSSQSRHSTSDIEAEDEHTAISECLGISTSQSSSINDEAQEGRPFAVPEPLFSALIRQYPRGNIFAYNANGAFSEDSDDPTLRVSGSDPDETLHSQRQSPAGKGRRKRRSQREADDLIKVFVGARNILLLPIWDTDRKRWFAGALAWTNRSDRIFSFEDELVFVSAFTNSVMAEIRRVDVEIAEKAKTNLVSSITHELRNPLHGILGTADILSDTAMNALQHGMVHTIESCGRTLLDTINNLLDLTFIDQYRKGQTAQGKKQRGQKKTDVPNSLTLGDKSNYTRVQLDTILEEVTECVFAGYCFYNHPQAPPPALNDSSSRSGGQVSQADPVGPQASQVTVILDIEPNAEWDFYTHAGAWRRILMNIFGNALKYTKKGFIYLTLKSSETNTHPQKSGRPQEFEVTLTVRDTGKGIGRHYLQRDLFNAFSQENPLAPGSGLGLSIVRQAVGYLGGSIEVESTQGVGTQLTIRTPLLKVVDASETSSVNSMMSFVRRYTEDKTIGILGFGQSLRSQRDTNLYSALERMCQASFGLKVQKISPLEGKHDPLDFYLAVQTELDCEDVTGRNLFSLPQHLHGDTWTSPVVVICQSPEEAHRMFIAAKSRESTAFFEFISQPCGPRKVARALDMCIKRRRDQQNGRLPSDEHTHWVEMPESSHLPVDVGPTEPPADRMKISKRPTQDTMGSPEKQERERLSVDEKQEAPSSHSQNDAETQSPAEGKGEAAASKKVVLLVDDNDLNLQLLCAYAKKEGYEYATANNGLEAVEIYKSDPGKFQVVIIDISMPIMNGFEASQHIRGLEKKYRAGLSDSERQNFPPLIIAALTGLDSEEAQREALGSGIDRFLIKPLKRPDLRAVLRRQV